MLGPTASIAQLTSVMCKNDRIAAGNAQRASIRDLIGPASSLNYKAMGELFHLVNEAAVRCPSS